MTEFYRPAGTYVLMCTCPDHQQHIMNSTFNGHFVCPHCNNHVYIQTITTEED